MKDEEEEDVGEDEVERREGEGELEVSTKLSATQS